VTQFQNANERDTPMTPYRANAAPPRPDPPPRPREPFRFPGWAERLLILQGCLVAPVLAVAAIGTVPSGPWQGVLAIYETIAYLWAYIAVGWIPDPPYNGWSTGYRWLAACWAPLFLPVRILWRLARWVALGD